MRWSSLFRRLPKTTVLYTVAVLLWVALFVWLVVPSGLLILLLAAATFWVIRPELHALLGAKGEKRPWLVRLREHSWRALRLPLGHRMPRWLAYALVAIAWWWLLC